MMSLFSPKFNCLLLLLVISLTSCGGGGSSPSVALSNMVPVRIAMHLPGQIVAQVDQNLLDKILDLTIPDAQAVIQLIGVKSVTINVTGAGFAPIIDSFNATPGQLVTRTFQVPQGASRTFTVSGYNTLLGAVPVPIAVVSGSTVQTIAPSATPVVVNIPLVPVAPTDTVAPIVVPPVAVTIDAQSAAGTLITSVSAGLFINGASATDNVGVVGGISNDAPAILPLGPTTVIFSATDAAGNVSLPVSAVITVADLSAPVIALLGANPLTVLQGGAFVDPGSNVTDNVDAGLQTTVTGVVNTAVLGPVSLSYNVSDAVGNAAIQIIRTVNVVVLNQAPVPTAPAITTFIGAAGTSQIAPNDPNAGDTHSYAITTLPANGTATVSAAGLVSYSSNVAGVDSLIVTVTDNGNPVLSGTVAISVTVQATTAQSWQTLKTNGDTVTAATQFQSAMTANPADFEAVIGFCTTQMADLMTNAAFRGLLASWTTDAGATLPTAAALAMNTANGTKTTINWVKKFGQLAVNGATVQANGFANALPVLNSCIINLESVLTAGFVSQSVQNPADWVRFPAGAVAVDVADVNLLLSIMYGARSEIYWLDAYNWNTDVDTDGIVDTVITSAVIGGITYQYSTMNIDPKAVLADPTFFTLRTAGALLSTGVSDLIQSLVDANAGMLKRKAALITFNANAVRAGNAANLFYYTALNLANLPQDLTDATNAVAALNGIGYTNPLFKQRDGTTATATIRADLAYTGVSAWDRTVMPFANIAYDVLPDPVASKMNNSPTFFDNGLGNLVHSNVFYGAYPDVTMKGVLAGGATLDLQDQISRPTKAFVLSLAGSPIVPFSSFTDPTGVHQLTWTILTDGTILSALEINQNTTNGSFVFTIYSVNQTSGVLTPTPTATGTLSGNAFGSGVSVGGNVFVPGSSGVTSGFWDLGIGTIVSTTAPAGTFSFNTLRSDGSVAGLIHWYSGSFFNGSRFATVSQLTSGGAATVREQYNFNFGFASPVGTDAILGWLVFDPDKVRLTRVVPGLVPQSAKVYYDPFFAKGGQTGGYQLVGGQFVDSTQLPIVRFFTLPTLGSFPALGTVDVFP